ncbi:transposable element Tcb2 transposase [Trichonephila clavipes]|uniref:Transposable element Tcb2 transposase n=1 Tax=Trichonephila clavipes TaxID=2585209 RepID=A0A8X6V1Y5_TRICX|nr:transposable element Tcb2 transposase [Trichonephila clavipes]
MDGNARPHRANLVNEFLESEDIKRIPWPANSPDLNPIENLWDYLGRAIARRHPPPRDVNGLKTALLEEWSLIPQTVINNVISSLKNTFILEQDLVKKFLIDYNAQILDKLITSFDEEHSEKDSTCCQVIYSQFGLAIHQNDHQARRRFVEWAQNEIAVVPDFHKRILFSDEARFWLNGYVNKQNCRIWSEANPQVYVETPLHPEKLTVWCALWAGGILLQKR